MLRATVGSGLVISWAGMRGILSLAAALALPASFPFRGAIVLTAFAVVLGTLVIQGLTLGPLPGARGLTIRFAADGVWRATRTPAGPATIHLRGGGERVDVEAWGVGADWALDHAPAMIGADDQEGGFESRHPVTITPSPFGFGRVHNPFGRSPRLWYGSCGVR